MGSFSYSFLLIYAKRIGFSIGFVPVLYLIFTVFAAIFSLPFGKLSDRIGRKAVLILAVLLWILVCLLFILSRGHWAIVGAFIVYGLHKAALEPGQKALVAELTPQEYKASSLGAFQMVIGFCGLPASLFAGLLWDKVSITAPFYFSIGLSVLSGVLLFFIKENKK